MLHNVESGLVRYVMADAQELGGIEIKTGTGETTTVAEAGIDVLLENLSFVAHSPRADWDTYHLQPLFSDNGLMMSITVDTHLGYPLSSEALFGKGARSKFPKTTVKAPEHPHKYFLGQADDEQSEVPKVDLVKPRLLNALDAIRTLSPNFVRL